MLARRADAVDEREALDQIVVVCVERDPAGGVAPLQLPQSRRAQEHVAQ